METLFVLELMQKIYINLHILLNHLNYTQPLGMQTLCQTKIQNLILHFTI